MRVSDDAAGRPKKSWAARRADKRALRDAGGFREKATYLGGHPEAVNAASGELLLEGRELSWSGQPLSKWGRRLPPQSFVIDVGDMTEVEYKGRDDLRNTPKGYWAPLPVPWLPGYGSQPEHPLGGKLTQLLVIRWNDAFGDMQATVFASTGFSVGPMSDAEQGGRELANRLIAARHRAKTQAARDQ